MMVKTREGRAIKAEGNPRHPVSKGGLCARGQAALQGLYHPDRFKSPLVRGESGALEATSWDNALGGISFIISDVIKKGRPEGIAFVSGDLGSRLGGLIDQWLERIGAGKRIVIEPLGQEALRKANAESFGLAEIPAYHIGRAECILSFSSDFLETGPSPVEHARGLAEARAGWGKGPQRFFHLGPRMNLTAANADPWLPIRPGSEGIVALAMVRVIMDQGLAPPEIMGDASAYKKACAGVTLQSAAEASGISAAKIAQLARSFIERRPSLAIGGSVMGPEAAKAWKAVNLLNALAGNIGRTVIFGTGTGSGRSSYADAADLFSRIEQGGVEILLVAGSPGLFELPFAGALRGKRGRAGAVVTFSTKADDASELADYVLPAPHFIESWDEYRPRAGVTGLVQPAMRPLYDTRAIGDVIIELSEKTGGENAGPYREIIRDAPGMSSSNGKLWNEVRKNGGSFSEAASAEVELRPEAFEISLAPPGGQGSSLVLVPFTSVLLYDGRGVDRPWLRECADPLSRISWDPWVELHPETAARLGLVTGDVANIKSAAGSGEWPVKVWKGVHPGAVAIPVRPGVEIDGKAFGSVMSLLPAAADGAGGLDWLGSLVEIKKADGGHRFPMVQHADWQHGRGIARDTDFHAQSEDREHWAEENQRQKPPRVNMYREFEYKNHKWSMVIDLDRCVGCNACAVACYAENNLPVVGRERVLEHREMAWIRIERYFDERGGMLAASFIPLPCQHCNNAPCESVCPVFATIHDPDGLNAQIYNRCIGTRFCSNNCPYKVRRFNWFTYQWPEPLNRQLNPEVTVREKGVMEKCSFCIQRITAARNTARREGREMRDGDVIPACAQSCPAGAIVFGDMNDKQSRVFNLKDYITGKDLESLAKLILVTGLIMFFSYATETFIAWYSKNPYEQTVFCRRVFEDYRVMFWIMIFRNSIVPLAFFFKRARTSIPAMLVIGFLINVGMWFERFVIIVTSLAHDYDPASWSLYMPTFVEIGLTIAAFGFFFFWLLLFIKFFPPVAVAEFKEVVEAEEEA